MAQRHPLQRLTSPSRTFSALLHIVGIASFSASFRYLQLYPQFPDSTYGGHFQFLTILGLGAALLTMVFGLLADITHVPQFFSIKNGLSVCSTPLEVLISILYWGICSYDKSLVVPPEVQHLMPIVPDVGFHAMPAIMLTLDLLLLSPPWTIKIYGAMSISMVLAFLYWGWVETCFTRNGFYPYPIFEILSTGQRVVLFTVSAFLMTISTMALKWAYGKLNGIEKFQKEAMKPAKVD